MQEPENRQKGGAKKIIPPHGGYRDLVFCPMVEIVHDATVVFCNRSRTHEQVVRVVQIG
ncbi:MAG TPA: hypothetical protein PLM79_10705 [Syntrophobacteraceae bacterium]|nr:hypothetical protein [Syntrophobacteraceae bacterium]